MRECLSVVFLCLLGWIPLVEARPPPILYLTWMHDPTTTMTVQWHTSNRDLLSEVIYRKMGEDEWQKKEGLAFLLPKTNVYVHTVELDVLEPGADYEFQLAERKGVYRFRTLPSSLSKEVKFVVGGDAYFYLSIFRKMNERIASCNPDFVIVGGDIAYTTGRRAVFKGKGWELERWRTFLKEWRSQMVTSDGRLIPIVPVIGNHDIKQTSLDSNPNHYFFYNLFAMPENGVPFRVFDVGDYLSLFLLDTGHTYNIEGMQSRWLKTVLSERESMPYKMAAYHMGGYPSVYPYRGRTPKAIRSQWSPLFEKYHLNVAFEHHNHAYKRSFPMKGNKINPDGVVYMGDGSWGVTPRKPKNLWYLEKVAEVNAICLVTLSPEMSSIEAINIDGKVFDSMTTFPTQAMVAWNEGRLLERE